MIATTLNLNIINQNNAEYYMTQAYNSCLQFNRKSWSNEAFSKPKLRNFIKIHNFNSNQILANASISRYQRSLLCQLKFGILPLKVETDRYQGIPFENRICKICDTNKPEDECNFLFSCPALEHIRIANLDLGIWPSGCNNLIKFQKLYQNKIYKLLHCL